MTYIPQIQLKNLKTRLRPNKVVLIYGARRTGKTTLVKKFLEEVKEKHLFVSGEDIFVQEYLSSQSIIKLREFIGQNRLLVIDEAQKVPNIGQNLKLIVDHLDKIKIIVTGSASFDLYQKLGEPLTGRKITLRLFPLSQMELAAIEKKHETASSLETRLIFGSYPEVILTKGNQEKILYLKELINSYLLKDALAINGLKQSSKLIKILQLLAFQIGQEVSVAEIGSQLGINKRTVERYLDILENIFVIFKLTGFSRNLRKEVSKQPKYYFYDNGVRNALINNFNPLDIRNDTGSLWENYLICERTKKMEYQNKPANCYFWRTYDQKEIDYIEERRGKLFAFEFKWSDKRTSPPADWVKTYKNSVFQSVNRINYLKFIS